VRNDKQELAGNPFYRFRVSFVHEKALQRDGGADFALDFFHKT
jgi:hypothetical protein